MTVRTVKTQKATVQEPTRHPRQTLHHLLVSVCLSVSSLSVHAGDVYRSVDARGVVTFSDVQTPGAVTVQIDAAAPAAAFSREAALAEQQRIIDQQLAVADSLEASRLAREAARAKRQEAIAAARAAAVAPAPAEPEVRYVSSYGSHYSSGYPGWRPGYPVHPWRPGAPGNPGYPVKPGYPGKPAHPAAPIAPPPPTTPTSFPVRFPYSDR